ncbi:MAG: hypothetical protein AUJ75_02450, partial [Candidatus Omnitrophica bacterium CG1_02_49_10]
MYTRSIDDSKDKRALFENIFLKGRRPWYWIILIGFLLYAKTLSFGFNYLDDNALILDNFYFISNLSNIPRLFMEDVFHHHSGGSYYRPLLSLSFMLDAQLGGAKPFIYRLTNVSLHVISASLVFSLLIKLHYKKILSFFFSLVFAVHPVLTQAVAWIPGRNDSLLTVFVLFSFIYFLDTLNKKNRASYLSHLLFFALALLTKETAVLLPVICVLYIILISRDKLFSTNTLYLICGWAVVAVPWFLVRKAALKAPIGTADFDIAGSLAVNAPAIVPFVGKAIFPFRLSVLPVMKDTPMLYGAMAIAIIIFLIIFSKKKRINFIIFGILWFLLFLVPSFIQSISSTPNFSEHRVYLSLIGLAFLFLEFDFVKKVETNNRLNLALGAFVVALFAAITFYHSDNFRDKISFWENAVRTSPRSAFNGNNLGSMYYLEGLTGKAERAWRKALELNPDERLVHGNLGLLYMDRSSFPEAEREYKKEIELNPLYDNVYFNLGILYYKTGRPEDAAELWEKTI